MGIFRLFKKVLNKIKSFFKKNEIYYINGNDTLPPPLDTEIEEAMIERISERKARDILIEHNLRLVVYIAKRFENTGAGIEELVSIGTVGLMKAISTFNKEKVFELYGEDYPTKDGSCVRDYINVEDLAKAHLLALDYLNKGGATSYFNLGTNEGNTVKEVFATCEKICNKEISRIIKARREGDPASLIANNSKAKNILNWEPQKTLEDSIKSAYEWERNLQK